ncbi:MAG: glycosyl hydrolase [Anditalea sp.]
MGGVEIAPIYGAKGYEDRYLDFLSEEWLNILKYTVEKAKSLDMGVDLTQGTGWPFGGPQVTEDAAASRILIQEYQISDGKPFNQAIVFEKRKNGDSDPELMALMAYGANGENKEITQHPAASNLNTPVRFRYLQLPIRGPGTP